MIEQVYQEKTWPDEHPELKEIFEKYKEQQEGSQYAAGSIARGHSVPLPDTDGYAATLTREGEMNISVIPLRIIEDKRCCLDGSPFDDLNKFEQLEALNLETVGVSQSWRNLLPDVTDEQICFLPMEKDDNGEFYDLQGKLRYSFERGLEKIEEDK